MTKTFIRTTLAAAAALVMLPAIASAQTPNPPTRKPVTQERKVEPQKAAPAKPVATAHKHGEAKRPGAQAHRNDNRQVADRRDHRDRHRDGRPDQDKRGERGENHG